MLSVTLAMAGASVGLAPRPGDEARRALLAAAGDPRGEETFVTTCGGKPVRPGASFAQVGAREFCAHRRLRGGLDAGESALVGIGSVLALWALYHVLPALFGCLAWAWATIVVSPATFVYDFVLTPVGHCGRDCVFVTKEACCGCCDACELCMHPYKRI